ncbi:MAG: hypothetical protein FWD83_04640 [Promicromonosporaceae bacterium]|nr:hypothetical protein [Promicromonosporaceae bacterium]
MRIYRRLLVALACLAVLLVAGCSGYEEDCCDEPCCVVYVPQALDAEIWVTVHADGTFGFRQSVSLSDNVATALGLDLDAWSASIEADFADLPVQVHINPRYEGWAARGVSVRAEGLPLSRLGQHLPGLTLAQEGDETMLSGSLNLTADWHTLGPALTDEAVIRINVVLPGGVRETNATWGNGGWSNRRDEPALDTRFGWDPPPGAITEFRAITSAQLDAEEAWTTHRDAANRD